MGDYPYRSSGYFNSISQTQQIILVSPHMWWGLILEVLMGKALTDVFTQLQGSLSKYYSDKKLEKYETQVVKLSAKYQVLTLEERHEPTYDSLCKRGVELLKPGNLKDENKLKYFLRYCEAALYDFRDDMKPLTMIMRSFMMTTMFFYLLTPQYFGYILPLIMVVPVFIGLRGMKKRSLNGLITGCTIVPLALMVGVVHFKSIFIALNTGYDAYVAELAGSYNFSLAFTSGLLTTMNILAAVMLLAGVTTAYLGLRHNKMFL